ncbi:hypothetical protein [Anabaena subtropica]|nr:hypothetical protein [Anabaena subtropica]
MPELNNFLDKYTEVIGEASKEKTASHHLTTLSTQITDRSSTP